jgi:4-alpha-glucanotransferase
MIGGTPGRRPRPALLSGAAVPRSARRPLQQLARLHGVQPGYQGTDGSRRRAGDEVLVATLAAMGVPIERPEGAAGALRATVAAAERTVLEPVVVHRGGAVTASVSIPHDVEPASVWVAFIREDGEVERRPLSATGGRPVAGSDLDGGLRLRHRIRFQGTDVPPGYHRLTVEGPGIDASAVVVSAPPRLPAPARTWGLSIPLYAVRTRGDWGVGSLSDLAELAAWAGEQGAGLVGTLPTRARTAR